MNLKHGGIRERPKTIERGCQPVDDSNELDHTSHIEETKATTEEVQDLVNNKQLIFKRDESPLQAVTPYLDKCKSIQSHLLKSMDQQGSSSL
ncbi:hypothetical protein A2U01_0012047 [Trifolium medium]|uniref:Uncharacterized protein n=1 Tax=Trifolium medium TaxID=97028 RepID=A0A392MV02_9FABA|nr:hypothetical protein [Trifolium medium]